MKRFIKNILIFFLQVITYPFYVIFKPIYIYIHKRKGKAANLVYNDIVEGWTNYYFPNEQIERIAKRRAAVCAECPSAIDSEFVEKLVEGENIKEIRGVYCKECSCPLSAKTRSINHTCPKGKWLQ